MENVQLRFPILLVLVLVLVLVPVLLLGFFGARWQRQRGVGQSSGLMGIGCLAGLFVVLGTVLLSFVGLRKVSGPTAVNVSGPVMVHDASTEPDLEPQGSSPETPAGTIPVTVKPGGKEMVPERPLSTAPAPAPLPEPPVMLRPSVVVKETPRPPEDPPVVAATSQWWADREQASRQASAQLLMDLVALRTETEQKFLSKPEHLRAVATHLEWSGEVEATEKDFGNGLRATMYRVHLRVPSQEKFVAELGGAMQAHAEEIRLIAVAAGFFNVTVLFAFLGWLFKRKPEQVAQPVAV